jgi:uncharacterized protein (DUF983 family)
MVTVRCPSCAKSLNVPDKYAGKKAKCPACQETLRIPEAPVEVTPVVSTSSRPAPPPLPDEDPDDAERPPQRVARRPRDDDYDDRPRRRPRNDDYDDDRPRRRSRGAGQWADCPNCGHDEATRVHWTFWGGMIGPAIINTVRCGMCGTNYNGNHGDYNHARIAIYMVVSIVLGLMIAGAFIAFQIMN